MQLSFSKMHGIGNDYILLNGFDAQVAALLSDAPALSQQFSDRHKGIGADGLIFAMPSSHADAQMRMFNADGSEGRMCGNGIRQMAKFLYEKRILRANPMRIASLSGLHALSLEITSDQVVSATVDMGPPVFEARDIPLLSESTERPILTQIKTQGHIWQAYVLSMGNPHAVIFTEEDLSLLDLHTWGSAIEHDAQFPERVNVEFVQALPNHALQIRVWERGSGETLACGTGACASMVAARMSGRLQNNTAQVHLPGGSLEISWDPAQPHAPVFMKGPITHVFDGSIALSN